MQSPDSVGAVDGINGFADTSAVPSQQLLREKKAEMRICLVIDGSNVIRKVNIDELAPDKMNGGSAKIIGQVVEAIDTNGLLSRRDAI